MDNANIDTPTEESEEKNKLKSRSSKKSALDFRKYTKQIWLAGLGAFSRAEEEGNKLFDSLVKVGEELESKTGDLADTTVGKVTEKAKESVSETKDKVEKILDTSVNHSLNRIGTPSFSSPKITSIILAFTALPYFTTSVGSAKDSKARRITI